MKNNKASTLTWLVTGLLCLTTAVACVDEQPSIMLEGSLYLDGTLEKGDADKGTSTTLNCKSIVGGATGAKALFARGQIDLSGIKRAGGQDSSADGKLLVNGSLGRQNQYIFVGGFYNRLPNSKSVGAQSGGGGGGFQNMNLDSNGIQTSGAIVRFLSENNTFQTAAGEVQFPGFEEFRYFSASLDSENGWAGLPIPILDGAGEIAIFENFLKNGLGNPQGPVSFMVEIQIKGKSIAGTEVESNIIRYPLDICVDCNMQSTPTCVAKE